MIPTNYYLLLSAILFGLGIVAFVFKRNIITIFMAIELMLNAVNLAFVAFSQALGKPRWRSVCAVRDHRGGSGSGRGTGNHHSDRAQPPFAQRGKRESAQTLMPILEHLWIIPLLPLLGSAHQWPTGLEVAE